MSEPPESNNENGRLSLRDRLQPLRARAKSAISFVSGVAAVLVALLLYNALVPAPPPLFTRDVNQAIVNAAASSSLVYQVIRPSFVLIQTNKRDPKSGAAFTDRTDGDAGGEDADDKGS